MDFHGDFNGGSYGIQGDSMGILQPNLGGCRPEVILFTGRIPWDFTSMFGIWGLYHYSGNALPRPLTSEFSDVKKKWKAIGITRDVMGIENRNYISGYLVVHPT